MRAALVLHGDPPGPSELALLDACQAIVCADGGADAVVRSGRWPTCVVGDLDSIAPDVLRACEARGVRIERLPPHPKDATDGELALDLLLSLRPESALLLGAHGLRSAMFLANLQLLRRCHEAGLDAAVVGHGEELRLASPGREVRLRGRAGALVSVLPLDGEVALTLDGLRYPARRLRLPRSSARGVSNTVATDDARVRVDEGLALVVVEGQP